VSDICVGFSGTVTGGDGRAYNVQQNWSNQAEDCITTGTARTISVGDASIVEGDSGARSLRFPVTLSAPSNATMTVKYKLQGVSATGGSQASGVDFDSAGGTLHTLTFAKNSSTGITPVRQDVVVPIYGDNTDEPDETFTVTLSSASAGYGIADAEGGGKVLDDDPKIATTTIGVGGGKIHRGLKGNRRLSIPITISRKLSTSVKVKWALHAGTAKIDSDYSTPTSGTVTIAANSMGATVDVLVYAKAATSDKAFTISIGTSSTPLPSHTKFSRTSATATILMG
jgi:chitinase